MKFSTFALLSCLSAAASAFAPSSSSKLFPYSRPNNNNNNNNNNRCRFSNALASTTADDVDTATAAMAESSSTGVTPSPSGTVDKVDISLGFEGVNSSAGSSSTSTGSSSAIASNKAKAKADQVSPLLKSTAPPSVKPDKNKIKPGRYSDQKTSLALPFLKRPPALDGSHAGDYGFDPLGLTQDFDLYTLQESELRHARLAMLAVVGWPLSELVAPDFMLQDGGRAPSVLNGFFGQDFFNPLPLLATVTIFAGFGYLEYMTALRKVDDKELGKIHRMDMQDVWKFGVAGDYNWDPLDLYNVLGDDAYARKGMRDLEISHGRWAMIGITCFAIWEALTGHAIVESGSVFFTPNPVLPALLAAYVAFNQFYELDQDEADMFLRFKLSSEGEAKMENLKMSLGINSAGSSEEAEGVDIQELSEKATAAVDAVAKAYEKVQEAYMNSVVDSDYKK